MMLLLMDVEIVELVANCDIISGSTGILAFTATCTCIRYHSNTLFKYVIASLFVANESFYFNVVVGKLGENDAKTMGDGVEEGYMIRDVVQMMPYYEIIAIQTE